MRPIRSLAVAALLASALSSCFAGPHQLRRTIDDWDRRIYVNSPWFNATLWIVPVLPICYLTAITCDFFVGDAYAFWFDDAWDGAGTAFVHAHIEETDGRVESLLITGSGWTRSEK